MYLYNIPHVFLLLFVIHSYATYRGKLSHSMFLGHIMLSLFFYSNMHSIFRILNAAVMTSNKIQLCKKFVNAAMLYIKTYVQGTK